MIGRLIYKGQSRWRYMYTGDCCWLTMLRMGAKVAVPVLIMISEFTKADQDDGPHWAEPLLAQGGGWETKNGEKRQRDPDERKNASMHAECYGWTLNVATACHSWMRNISPAMADCWILPLLLADAECLRKQVEKDLRAICQGLTNIILFNSRTYIGIILLVMWLAWWWIEAGGRKGLAGQLVCAHCIIDSNNIKASYML